MASSPRIIANSRPSVVVIARYVNHPSCFFTGTTTKTSSNLPSSSSLFGSGRVGRNGSSSSCYSSQFYFSSQQQQQQRKFSSFSSSFLNNNNLIRLRRCRYSNTTIMANGSSNHYKGNDKNDDIVIDKLLADVRSYDKQYINGKWIPSTNNNNNNIDVTDPNTGTVIASVPNGTKDDTNLAIDAAKNALPYWSQQLSVETRIEYIETFLDCFEKRIDEINHRTVMELGCTMDLTSRIQTASLPAHTKTLLETIKKKDGSAEKLFEWEYGAGKSTVVKEPVGVVGCVTPWNYPVSQIALKVVPALLAGCTVVLKPSEVTPLVAYSVTECIDEAKIPNGVFNMVMGTGVNCAEILATHPDVDLVSFTGSTRVGRILTQSAAKTLKPIKTELGGKSAALLLEDARYESVVPKFVKQLMNNTGQSCNALSRMIIPNKHYDRVVDIIVDAMNDEVVGDTRMIDDKSITMGPLVNRTQYDRAVSLIRKGTEEGAILACGGIIDEEKQPNKNNNDGGGYYVQPTLFKNVTNDMTIARTEIFGPVLCAIPYDTVEEAIRITNDTPYGLNNAVASSDPKKAIQVASKLKSGMVMMNDTYMDMKAPFGGYKQSGNAREWGVCGLEEYLITKTINVDVNEYRKIVYGKNRDVSK